MFMSIRFKQIPVPPCPSRTSTNNDLGKSFSMKYMEILNLKFNEYRFRGSLGNGYEPDIHDINSAHIGKITAIQAKRIATASIRIWLSEQPHGYSPVFVTGEHSDSGDEFSFDL